MHINKFTSGCSPSFKWPAQDVIEEMKKCLILSEEKYRLSNRGNKFRLFTINYHLELVTHLNLIETAAWYQTNLSKWEI